MDRTGLIHTISATFSAGAQAILITIGHTSDGQKLRQESSRFWSLIPGPLTHPIWKFQKTNLFLEWHVTRTILTIDHSRAESTQPDTQTASCNHESMQTSGVCIRDRLHNSPNIESHKTNPCIRKTGSQVQYLPHWTLHSSRHGVILVLLYQSPVCAHCTYHQCQKIAQEDKSAIEVPNRDHTSTQHHWVLP